MPECNITNFITKKLGEADEESSKKIETNFEKLKEETLPSDLLKKQKTRQKQSEWFFQFFRSYFLEMLYWDWEDKTQNIPRKVYSKVKSILFPNGSGEVSIPQLADMIMIPNSDWFIKQNFVELGNDWKVAYLDTLETLNAFGFYIPNFLETSSYSGFKNILFMCHLRSKSKSSR